jgi:small subunit ribosomal protein S15
MGLTKEEIQNIVKRYGLHEKDVGSPEVQIVILSEEIKRLTEHLKRNKKDHNSKRGLILKIAQRRKLLKYLERKSIERYQKIVKELKL